MGEVSETVRTTDDGTDRAYQKCQCSVCGVVAICTEDFDFYAKNIGDPLVCEVCFGEFIECSMIGITIEGVGVI